MKWGQDVGDLGGQKMVHWNDSNYQRCGEDEAKAFFYYRISDVSNLNFKNEK